MDNPWIVGILLIIGLIILFNGILTCYVCYHRNHGSNERRASTKIKYNKIISIDDEYDTTSEDLVQDGI